MLSKRVHRLKSILSSSRGGVGGGGQGPRGVKLNGLECGWTHGVRTPIIPGLNSDS